MAQNSGKPGSPEPGAAGTAPADAIHPHGPVHLAGMGAAEAKEYILGFITTLKLTEQESASLEAAAAVWKDRMALARSRGAEDLYAAASEEAGKAAARLAALREEERRLKGQIAAMRKQLTGLAARERGIDPDLLEQELLIAAGYLPGDEEKARDNRLFTRLEKEAAADAALEALKAKMKETPR